MATPPQRRRPSLATAAALVLTLAVGACSSDGEDVAEGCDGQAFVGSIDRTSAVDGHEARSITGDDIVDGVAVAYDEKYSVVLGDHEIPGDLAARADAGEVADGWPSAEPGGTLVTVAFRSPRGDGDRALAEGEVVDLTRVGGEVIVDTGGGPVSSSARGLEGTIEVLHVGEDRLCLVVDQSDDGQAVAGTIDVPLHRSPNPNPYAGS